MREAGIVGVHLRKKVTTTVPAPHAAQVPDLLQRDFTASDPNTNYVGDGQFLYLATVLDLRSKRLAGWAIADHTRTELVTDAPEAAARTRCGDLAGAVLRRQRSPVRLAGLRERMPQIPRDPLSRSGRDKCGQRRCGELQRGPEAGDPAGTETLARSTQGPPRSLPLDHLLQHQAKAFSDRPGQPDRLRTTNGYADLCRIANGVHGSGEAPYVRGDVLAGQDRALLRSRGQVLAEEVGNGIRLTAKG